MKIISYHRGEGTTAIKEDRRAWQGVGPLWWSQATLGHKGFVFPPKTHTIIRKLEWERILAGQHFSQIQPSLEEIREGEKL